MLMAQARPNCVVNQSQQSWAVRSVALLIPSSTREAARIDECLAVAATQGLTLHVDFVRQIAAIFGPSHNIASMLQDLQRGRPTEIDYMNGALAALGAEQGVPCPVNAALAAIVREMEAQSPSLLREEMLKA